MRSAPAQRCDCMTHASVDTAATHFTEGDFRVGRVLGRAVSMLSRRFLPFCIVTFVAFLPLIVTPRALMSGGIDPDQTLIILGLSIGLAMAQMMISTFT